MPCTPRPQGIVPIDTIIKGASAASTSDKVIIVAIDHHSRYVWASANKSNNASAAISLLSLVLKAVGHIEAVLTDNGTNYTSTVFTKYLKSNNIKHLRASAYHPQTVSSRFA